MSVDLTGVRITDASFKRISRVLEPRWTTVKDRRRDQEMPQARRRLETDPWYLYDLYRTLPSERTLKGVSDRTLAQGIQDARTILEYEQYTLLLLWYRAGAVGEPIPGYALGYQRDVRHWRTVLRLLTEEAERRVHEVEVLRKVLKKRK